MNSLVLFDDNPLEIMIIQRTPEKYKLFTNAAFSPDAEIIIDLIDNHRFEKVNCRILYYLI